MKEVDLSIVIVCFNSRAVLLSCLDSIYASFPLISFEVILVDNGSKDGSIKDVRHRFRNVIIVEAGYNSGYAGGNNIGFKKSKGRYILFLNPDTLIQDGVLDQIVSRMDSYPLCGAIGPRILNYDGSLQRCCYRSPVLSDYISYALMFQRIPGYVRLFGFRGYRDDDYDSEMEVDAVSGCCLLVRREIFNEIEGFDEEYFMYYEDMDLCERIRRNGYKVIYYPSASIVHLEGASTLEQKTWLMIQMEQSRRRFFAKYRSKSYEMAARAILLLALIRRMLFGTLAFILTGGCSKRIRSKTSSVFKILCWQLGLVKHGPRPS